jgi:NADPH:quinone reductase-like Zn-dependent oxidoreductase
MPMPFPAVLGRDVSGTVEVSRAEGYAAGEDVFAIAASGGYAEFATASAAAIAKKPPGVSHEQAAAIPVSGLTAWQALFDHGGLKRGQTALIAGAAGGVGHFAVQFAHHGGARVIGTGSSRNREFVLDLGADEYIDYTQQDVATAASGVDVALDTWAARPPDRYSRHCVGEASSSRLLVPRLSRRHESGASAPSY